MPGSTDIAPPPSPPAPAARPWPHLLGVVVLVVVLAASALAYAVPWLPDPPNGGRRLADLFPFEDGRPALFQDLDGEGATRGFRSQTTRVLSPLEAFGVLPAELAAALTDLASRPGEDLGDVEAVERLLGAADIALQQVTRLDTTQEPPAVLTSQALYARTANGLFQLGFTTEDGTAIRLDPEVLIIPARAEPGDRWTREGTLNGVAFRYRGHVVREGGASTPAGRFEDCLEVEAEFTVGEGETRSESLLGSTYCAGTGEVLSSDEATGEGADGSVLRSRLVAVEGRSSDDPDRLPPPMSLSGASEMSLAGSPLDWGVSRFARSLPTGTIGRATIPPTYVQADPPIVLAAAEGGDLVAFDADTADERWRFHPGGNIYGAPVVDPDTGRIYFGASDRTVYALDSRGLFLWALELGDNVPTRPLVADGVVIVGSEDGFITGIDASTGERRWSREAAGPVASSPALAGGLAVIGSDDGALYAFDPKTGERRWRTVLGGPIESAPAAVENAVYAADRDGQVVAVDARTGDEIWSLDVGATVRDGVSVSTTAELVVVTTDFGRLIAIDRLTGRRRWQTGEIHSGAPIALGNLVIAATQDGKVHFYGADGSRVQTLDARDLALPTDADATFALGGTLGGGFLWLADDSAVVYRVGRATEADEAGLVPVWNRGLIDEPFEGGTLKYSPAPFGDEAVVLDDAGVAYLVDPVTGDGAKVGEVGDGPATADPVVDGDLLLVSVGATLNAATLPEGRPRWTAVGAADSIAIRPPVVAGDTVLWATFADGSGELLALDRETGAQRWSAPLASATGGGVEVVGNTVFTSTPPAAFDLESGVRRWEQPLAGSGLGGPAASGDLVVVAQIVSPEDGPERSTVAALDASTGAVRWETDVPSALTLYERMWIDGETVVVPTLGGPVFGLDLVTGAQRWAFDPGAGRYGTVAVEAGSMTTVLLNGDVDVIDVATGERTGHFGGLDLPLDTVDLAFARPVRLGDLTLVSLGFALLGLAPGGDSAPTGRGGS